MFKGTLSESESRVSDPPRRHPTPHPQRRSRGRREIESARAQAGDGFADAEREDCREGCCDLGRPREEEKAEGEAADPGAEDERTARMRQHEDDRKERQGGRYQGHGGLFVIFGLMGWRLERAPQKK